MSNTQAFRVQKANSDSFSSIALGKSNYHMAMLLTPKRGVVGLETVMDGPYYESRYRFLEQRKYAIEESLGANLKWFETRRGKSARVLLEASLDPKNDLERDKVIQWFCDWVPKWYEVFGAYAKQLPTNEPAA